MRTQDNPVFIMPILEGLIQAEGQFTTRGLASALTTLGFLARHQEDRSIVRSLAGKLNHPKKAVQTAAMRALEQLQDPRSIPILRNWVHGDPEDERFKAAQKAITSLNKQIEAPQALQRLRNQVDTMEKTTALSRNAWKHSKTNGTPWKPPRTWIRALRKRMFRSLESGCCEPRANTDLALP